MKSPEEIIRIFSDKTIDKDWVFARYKVSETNKWTHCYHRYPTKFIPQLVEKIFDEYTTPGENIHVNDPFCGSGTTIVTALSRGFRASGADINRIAYLVTKAKAVPIEPKYLEDKILQFFSMRNRFIYSRAAQQNHKFEPLIPVRHAERIDYWFPWENQIELGRMLRAIYDETDYQIRNFMMVAFSHILKGCSIWLQGSVKPIRDMRKRCRKPYNAMRSHLTKMQEGNREFYNIVPPEIRANLDECLNIKIADARFQPLQRESVDLIVSSSPYVTSYEYADLHQLSTIWFDLTEDLTEYKREFIGTSRRVYSNRRLRSIIARSIVNKMLKKDKRLAKEIEAFYIDMEAAFDDSYRILIPGGRCFFVIGNTVLKDIDILNAEVFTESLQYSGFKLERVIKRRIPVKTLPQKRDARTGKFADKNTASIEAYPVEYILIALKE